MRVAIIGCGQLSRMMALAGLPMGLTFSFVAEADEDSRCVDGLGEVIRRSEASSAAELFAALGKPQVITVEREQVDIELLRRFSKLCPVHPNPDAVYQCQHRGRERQLLAKTGIDCAPYQLALPGELAQMSIPLPAVIKSCDDGYDGKNQWRLKQPKDSKVFAELPRQDVAYLVESFIHFDRELSQVSARDRNGNIVHYPLAENVHTQGILSHSTAPAPDVSAELAQQAQRMISTLMTEMDYVGVLAVECFAVGDKLLVNELAPRVHNSGHWSQSGSQTCQFENHLRAITGLPLGATDTHGVTGMVNLIGTDGAPLDSLDSHSQLHWYGKTVRAGRKLGHININASGHDVLQPQVVATLEQIKPEGE
ncbi:5-(carboxyamino)imidazole ribonucleotide synthase [Ferrimonas senticii]|uniref:5-(carboxyamino)imidazole ribonucleotide synthase n=1 Tax=Ferrimonas senticii TaxID=394566 RepID=UPI0004258E83|nr:5-(carboxyamino)imidazole ribonucleotide synthase [Ferrimonas senticii]